MRARLGYVFTPSLLGYATGGGAWGHSSTTYTAAGSGFSDGAKADGFGWVAGAGLEYKVTDHLLLRSEYLHYGFSSFDYDRPRLNPATATGKTDIDVVRGGLSYKF